MSHRNIVFAGLLLAGLTIISTAALAADIVVEARCASGGAYIEGGTGWGNSSSKSNRTSCSNGSRSSKNAAAYADFIPPIAVAGLYDVYLTWGPTTSSNNGPNAEGVQVSLVHRDGTLTTTVNMRGHSGCAQNADQLVYAGRGYFEPGQGHRLRVSHTGTGQCYNGASKRYVSADAAIFTPVPQAPVPALPVTWSTIKTRIRD